MSEARGESLWWAAAAASFALLAIATPLLLNAAVVAAGARPGQDPLEVVNHVERGLATLEYSRSKPDLDRIAFLGDSTVTAFEWRHTVPDYLERALNAGPSGGKRLKVVSLAFPGMGNVGYFFLADMIGAADPDLVVWETSFTHLSARWWERNARPGLVGWLPTYRLREAFALPLDELGITLDELLLYKGIHALGAEQLRDTLHRAQSRAGKWRRLLENAIAKTTGRRPEWRFSRRAGFNVARRANRAAGPLERYRAPLEREHYGQALTGLDPGHPALTALRHGLAHFRDLGIPVVVYLNPINVDNLAAVGLLDREAISASVEIFREAVEENGGRFVDLHDLFPDHYFRDAAGHFVLDEEVNSPAELVRALAGPVRNALDRAEP